MESLDKLPFHVQLDMIWGPLNPQWRIGLSLSEEMTERLIESYQEDNSQYDELLKIPHDLLNSITTIWLEVRPLVKGDTILFDGELLVVNGCEFRADKGLKDVILSIDYAYTKVD